MRLNAVLSLLALALAPLALAYVLLSSYLLFLLLCLFSSDLLPCLVYPVLGDVSLLPLLHGRTTARYKFTDHLQSLHNSE